MRALIVIALLTMAVPARAQTVLWFSGLETASVEEFISTARDCGGGGSGFNAAHDGGQHAGDWYLHVGSGTCIRVDVAGSLTTVYTRFWYGPAVTVFSSAPIVTLDGTSGSFVVFVKTDHNLAFGTSCCTAIATGTTPSNGGAWNLVEAKFVFHASAGGVELKLNGTTLFTSFGTALGGTATRIAYGGWTGGGGNQSYDDLMLCSGAYCPLGVTIARQGAAGTPTYNSWTKNSCTGGTINGCWSDTAYSAGSNASSATASAAQTMFVHDFATTQSGHGTETVGNASTINACKTSIIAKSGTASAPLSIRRRIGGTDTDTAKTLTTSDAYYDDGIWTTTATELRGSTMEIGAVHGAGTDTDTVEDVWLNCDYLNASGVARHRVTQQ